MDNGASAESSLRDDLARGLAEIEAREAPAAAAPEGEQTPAPEAQPEPQASETQSDRGDGRDAHGRFVSKSGSPKDEDASQDQAGQVAAQPSDTKTPQSESAQEAPSSNVEDQPPKSWRSEEASTWAALPKEAKAAILRREADNARLAGANDAERMFGREMADLWRPHIAEIQAQGATPQLALKALLANHAELRNPQTRVAAAQRLLREYGIPVEEVAQPNPNAPSDPFVLQLQSEIAQLKARLGQPQQQQFAPLPPTAEEHNIMAEIEAFRADPAHPHFDAVHVHMGKLLETGAATDLESAYQAAVALNPALRFTAPPPAQPQRTQQEDKTAAARRASVSVTGSPGQTGSPKPISLRDELAEGLRSAGFSV